MLKHWYVAVENNFIWSSFEDIRMHIGSNTHVVGSFGTMTVTHNDKILSSWIFVILGPKENFPCADVPEQTHRHSQKV